MLKQIIKIANKLDSLGMTKEADVLDSYLSKRADNASPPISSSNSPETVQSKMAYDFLKVDPKNMLELNNALAGLFSLVPKNNDIIPPSRLAPENLPTGEFGFTAQTGYAFDAFCDVVEGIGDVRFEMYRYIWNKYKHVVIYKIADILMENAAKKV